ncbi:hypothetical protein FEM48_Zijuj03G0056900 [Ziziphus jujuba var. spinosa]|uniref:Protein NUCLEAR FUSION DEFECTIVE 4-like n=1 Tax=Ziziphus jujuba var. spinosa TaxID=714518 RepID=A0A978VNI3_ZIZJJ|nr:hypothetical protein FEM48_Zijuj03G0056900 [Ziziphus jujuba var. spinosa]
MVRQQLESTVSQTSRASHHQVLTGRWLMVFASFLVMATAGASYMFGLYSNDIKSVLGYDQTTLNLISFFKDLGANIGIFSGLINEITPPWVVLAIGAAFNFFGYFMIWLSITQRLPKPHVWLMCFYIFIGANSHTFMNTGALVTCVKNLPNNRGTLMGVLGGSIALSAALISQLYHVFYGDDTKSFTLVIAWLPTALALMFLRLIRIMKVEQNGKERKVLYKFFYISLSLAVFLLMVIIVESKITFTKIENGGIATVVLFLLFLPIFVVVAEEYDVWKANKRKTIIHDQPTATAANSNSTRTQNPNITTGAVTTTIPEKEKVYWWKNVFQPPEIGEDHTILQAIFSVEMITLLLTTICGLGGTLTLMDNLGFCFGAHWPLILSIISEIFGLKHYSTLYNIGSMASPIGLYLLNVRVTGRFYDKEAMKQLEALGKKRKAGEELNCNGGECFKLSFIIITGVTLFGTIVSLFLVMRTRKYYQSDIYRKFREDQENVAENETLVVGNEVGRPAGEL